MGKRVKNERKVNLFQEGGKGSKKRKKLSLGGVLVVNTSSLVLVFLFLPYPSYGLGRIGKNENGNKQGPNKEEQVLLKDL